MEFKEIGDILELQRGYDLPVDSMVQGDIPVVGSNGIVGYHNTCKSITPTITLGRSGTIGKVHYYNRDTWVHNTAMYVSNFKGNNPLYLYYLLDNLNFENFKSSSVVPSLNRNYVYPVKVPFYSDIRDQEKIANCLSIIDQKIALNTRMNAELEAMAKQLYDYWFVQFDFPDENGNPYKSSGGKMVYNPTLKREIPAGWNASNICIVSQILSGGTPSKAVKQYWENGNIPFFGPTDYEGYVFQMRTADHITERGLNNCASSLFEEGDIIITARGSIGKLVIVGVPMAMNQSCYALRPKNNQYEYLFFLTKQLIEYLKIKGNGSVFKSIIASDIEDSIMCIATDNVIYAYCEKVSPLFLLMKKNTEEIINLTHLRDSLLPMLMNGQVTVEK